MADLRANPFCDRGEWFWRNAEQVVNGPYPSQMDALWALMRYLDKRTWTRKFKDLLSEFIHS